MTDMTEHIDPSAAMSDEERTRMVTDAIRRRCAANDLTLATYTPATAANTEAMRAAMERCPLDVARTWTEWFEIAWNAALRHTQSTESQTVVDLRVQLDEAAAQHRIDQALYISAVRGRMDMRAGLVSQKKRADAAEAVAKALRLAIKTHNAAVTEGCRLSHYNHLCGDTLADMCHRCPRMWQIELPEGGHHDDGRNEDLG